MNPRILIVHAAGHVYLRGICTDEFGVTQGQLMAADRVALARDVITYGTTEADIALTSGPSSGGLLAAPYAPTLVTTQHDLAAHWPPGTAPSANPPTVRPDAGDPLPQADERW